MRYTNLNGKITDAQDAVVAADSRGLRYGYGLFETMLVRNGSIQLAHYHWERLFAGMKALYFDIPKLMTADALEAEVLKTVRKNKPESLCRVRLQVFADNGGLFDGNSQKPQYIIECYPLEEHTTLLNETGLVLGIAIGLQKAADGIANYKTSNALIYALAAQQAKQNKWNDALVCNTHGHIIESTIANLFWIKNNIIYTPPLTNGCVAGVMRRHIMDKLPVTEQSLDAATLATADGVFLTNAIRGIKWIARIGDASYTKNAVVAILNSL
ncbi:hypothetical protein CAP35_03185 [Chitinophagaceae bacterium IBVUCB1]|nr:hypothetical protein CAP35_03185 [Chitinophagaceae bacterium IBVUCB1]